MDIKPKLDTQIKLRMMCPTCDKEVGPGHLRCPEDGGLLCPVAGQDPLLGETVENYQVLNVVGQGSSSTVYLAKHRETGMTFAMKVLKGAITTDPTSVKRFQQEAKALIALEHTDIPSVYDFGLISDGRPFIIMEYVFGDTLTEVLKEKGRLDSNTVIQLFLGIADVLDVAHRAGILHRDIKPSNIIIDTNGNVKVVDFGLAKIAGLEASATVTRTNNAVLGTPAYMSPEQCYGQDLDARSDVYSLGCVMYECLTGSQVFASSNSFKCMHDHVFTAPKAVSDLEPGVSLHLDALVLHCLEKEPAMRVQSMAELKLSLNGVRDRSSTKMAYVNKSFRDLKTKARRTIKQHRNKRRQAAATEATRRTLQHPLGSANFTRMVDSEKRMPFLLGIVLATAVVVTVPFVVWNLDSWYASKKPVVAEDTPATPTEHFEEKPWEIDPWNQSSMVGLLTASPKEQKEISTLSVNGVFDEDGVWSVLQERTEFGKIPLTDIPMSLKTVGFNAFAGVPSKTAGEWFLLSNSALGFYEVKKTEIEMIPIQYYVTDPGAITYDTKRDCAAILDTNDSQSIHLYKKQHLPWSELNLVGDTVTGTLRGLAYDSASDCFYTMMRGSQADTATYMLQVNAADGAIKSKVPLYQDLCSLNGWNAAKISLTADKGYLIANLIRTENLHEHDMTPRQFVIKPSTGEIVYARDLLSPKNPPMVAPSVVSKKSK